MLSDDLKHCPWPKSRPGWEPRYISGYEMPADGGHILGGPIQDGVVAGWMGTGVEQGLREMATQGRLCLELGSWLGWSARTMLDENPDLTVICADLFHPPVCPPGDEHPQPYQPTNQLELFIHRNWDYRDRIVIMPGESLLAISEVARVGISPDLVYVDSGHFWHICGPEIASCSFLWPDAKIFGDDYPIPGVTKAVQRAIAFYKGAGKLTGRFWELRVG